MYKVMVICKDSCRGWEDLRETFRTDDPVDAIERSDIHRDEEHFSWVEVV